MTAHNAQPRIPQYPAFMLSFQPEHLVNHQHTSLPLLILHCILLETEWSPVILSSALLSAKEHLRRANYVDQKKRNAITVDQAANRV